MAELNLQDQTRRDDAYYSINRIIKDITNLDLFPSLVWVYVWDIIKDKLSYYTENTTEDYATNSEFTEKDVWDIFWEEAPSQGFSLEYGTEQLHDEVFDWMLEKDIIVLLDNDGWLDGGEQE